MSCNLGWWPNHGWMQKQGEVSSCNQLGGTDGQQWPPFLKKGQKLWIFQSEACRSIALTQASPDLFDVDGEKDYYYY